MFGSKLEKSKIVLNNYIIDVRQANDFIKNKHLTRAILIIFLYFDGI